MSQQNLIAIEVTDADLLKISEAVEALRTTMVPYLQRLSAQDRQELPKMGDKTLAFVQKSLEYAKVNADLVPPFLDMNALAIDFKAVQVLQEIAYKLNPITEALNDSIMLSGSEAYQGALVFYNSVKSAAKIRTGDSLTIYTDLSERFPRAAPRRQA